MRRDRDKARGFAHARFDRATRIFLVLVVLSGISFNSARSAESKRVTLDEWGVTIEYRASDEKVASEVASICRESLPRLSGELGLSRVGPFHVFLVPDVGEYERKLRLRLPKWGIAFAFPEVRIMIVDVPRATNAWNSLDKVIPHEISHMLLAERTPGARMPLWFMEGLAQWQAREWTVVESWHLMEDVWGNRVPGLDQIESVMPADESQARDAYRVAYSAFQFRFGDQFERLPGFLDEIVRRGDFRGAFEAYWRETEGQFAARFGEYLSSKYKNNLFVFQTGPLFTLASLLFIVVLFKTWLANRRRLKRMADEERNWPGS